MNAPDGAHVPPHPARGGRQEQGGDRGLRAPARPARRRLGVLPLGQLDDPGSRARGRRTARSTSSSPIPTRESSASRSRAADSSASTASGSGSRRASRADPDPFQQALDHRYDLERKIEKVKGWRRQTCSSSTRVCFPDITVHKLVLAPDAPPEIVIDSNGVAGDGGVARAGPRLPPRRQGEAAAARRGGHGDAPRPARAPTSGSRCTMAPAFLDEEHEIITLTHEQASAAQQPRRKHPRVAISGCAGSGQDDDRRRAGQAARRRGPGGRLRLLQPPRCATTCASASRTPASTSRPSTASACTWPARPSSSCPTIPRARRRQSYWDDELPEILVEAIEELGAAVRRALRRRGPGPREPLARRAHVHAARPRARARSGSSSTTTSRSTEPGSTCPTSSPRSTSPSTAATRKQIAREVAQEVPGRARCPTPLGPDGPRHRADPHRRPAGDRRGRPRAPHRKGGGPAAGHRRPLLPRPREVRGRPRRAGGAVTFTEGLRAGRPLRPVLARSAASRASRARWSSSASSRTSTRRRSTSSSTSGSRGRRTTA